MLKKIFILLLISIPCFAEEDCVFNPDSATNPFLSRNPIFISYHWEDSKKEGSAILHDGSLLYIKKWACTHVGLDARLIVMYPDKTLENKQYWIDRALKLGKDVLDAYEYQLLNDAIKKKSYKEKITNDEIQISIPDEMYSEFLVTVSEKNYMTVIAIYYYFN